MQDKRNTYQLVAIIGILIFVVYYFSKQPSDEWVYNLKQTNKQAYGTYLTYELIKNKNKSTGFIEITDSLERTFRSLDSNKHYNYFFFNYQPYWDSAKMNALLTFVENGNTAFICSESLYGIFNEMVLINKYHIEFISSNASFNRKNEDINYKEKSYTTFNFTQPNFKDKSGYIYFKKDDKDTVTYFNYCFAQVDSFISKPMDEEDALSYIGTEDSYQQQNNVVLLKHGKGQFIVSTSVLPFTNYFMRTPKGLEYAEKLLAYLPNQTSIWDNVSHIYIPYDDTRSMRGESSFGESPLYFILNNAALRWAWYLTILGIIIYIIFHAKRRQNIIPIIEPKQNNSLKYVETIGQLYYRENEHLEIANEMRLQFLNYIRKKYHLKTNEQDDTFLQTLSLKSGIETEKISQLFNTFNLIEQAKPINATQLQRINQQLEYFYRNSK
ncbi:MAG: DUF4350 domain-containing protein [Chitinophagales bacterium]|nr:hypothetical protein [Bacteroidota bacterium]